MLAYDTSGGTMVPVVVTSTDFAGAHAHQFMTGMSQMGQPLHVITTPQPTIVNSLKRGSEDLLSHSLVANGNGMSPQMDPSLEAKKVRLDQPFVNTKPSRVLHFRGIPADTTEAEIVQLGMAFGRMTNLVLAKKKNQALLEMGDVASAQTMVKFYSERPPSIRGRTIYVQFSNHEELKTEQSNVNAGAQAAISAANNLVQQSIDEPRTVLRVIVENCLYPVTIEVLKTIFSRFGQVLKIVIFNKNNTFQALVQFGDPMTAQGAKTSLNGQNIYNGCCTLRIDYSKLQSLNVKFNNDKSRDFTNPSLPTNEGPSMQPMDTGALGLGLAGMPGANMLGASHLGGGQLHTTLGGGLAGLAHGAVPFGLAGGIHQAGAIGLRLPGQSGGTVLLVSNLNEEKVNPDALFTLFGVYGDVVRVKVMFNKKDNALIQFTDATQAQIAMSHLDKVKLWGKPIKIAPSKHQVVQLPKEGQPDAGLTKDYTGSPLHRFKKPNSKNYQNIYPPSATLHLSNIPPSTTQDQLVELFQQYGEVRNFKFFQKDRKMALIQMDCPDEAIEALIETHNHQLAETSHLRVSFSKSTIRGAGTLDTLDEHELQQPQVVLE